MLADDIWAQITRVTSLMLCLDCAETVLGRKITRVDLRACPASRQLVKFADRARAGEF